MFSLSVTALYIAYGVPIAARFLGSNDFKPGPFNLGRLSGPVATLSCLWMLFMGIVFLFPTSPAPSVPDMNYTIVVMGGVMILSLVYYYFPKYGGVYWFKGPIANIDDENSDSESVSEKKKQSVDIRPADV